MPPLDAARRRLLFTGAGALLCSLGAPRAGVAAAPSPLERELVAAHRILAHHGVTGRVSVRDERGGGRYLTTRGGSARRARPGDVVAHELAATPGDPELAGHAAIYRAHPEIRAIARVPGIRAVVTAGTLPEVVFHAVTVHQAPIRRIRP